ncbi:putative tyrosine carboxypeptidase MATCAP2 [Watersipora subatra]|uniref:putative tyrosine carboxypeptidase MATCAP2 n=1 Tax=Watersipora subatra TaxID=2589382 RepID=UPI00355B6E0D
MSLAPLLLRASASNPLPKLSPEKPSSTKAAKPKKAKSLPTLVAVKPLNLEAEKKKFFDSGGTYNPQFVYPAAIDSKVLHQYGEPSSRYLAQALKIIRTSLSLFGTFTNWERCSGGHIMTKHEVTTHISKYLKAEGIEDEIQVNITHNILARASMTRVKGKPTINVKEGTTHSNWIEGMLNHEIGTHYLRAYNNKKQPWRSGKRRRQLKLLSSNPTEEGFASLNTVMFREQPLLLRSSLMYVVIFLASKMSFCQVYEKLKQYIDDPEERWKHLLRAKRGLTDTSKPGCFSKDQIYLTGALQILARRHEINFEHLFRFGKVSHRDLEKLEEIAAQEGTRVPKFLSDKNDYLNRLNYVIQFNGLTDEDLKEGAKH